MQTGHGLLPARAARYIIELLRYLQPGQDAGTANNYFYRITALGFGARETTQVVLQSYYRKTGSPPAKGSP